MLQRTLAAFFPLYFAAAAPAAVAATHTCAGSVPVTSFRLSASPAGSTPTWVPFWRINNLAAGTRIRYQPGDLPADVRRDAKLTLVLVPKAADGAITVLEPRAAAGTTEWQAPFAARIVLLVFAPQGLDEKRLTNQVTKDDVMATALADYAEQTADLEASMNAISDLSDFDDDAVRPRANTPGEQAMLALVRALNPAVSSYDPLSAARRAGSATMMGKGAEAFFDNAGAMFPGGGVLPAVKPWLLPDTEFRSVYQTPLVEGDMALCAKVQQRPAKNAKVAYLWAYHVSGAAAPAISTVVPVTHLPLGLRAGVPLKLAQANDWRLLSRVFDWTLTAESGGAAIPITARPVEDERALQLDLRKFSGSSGTYRIEGKWDWGPVKLNGTVWLHRLDDLKAVHVSADSQDRLVTGTGPVTVQVTGADLAFIDRAFLHRPMSSRQIPVDLPMDLAPVRADAAAPLVVEIETDGLRPGPYALALSRVDGATAEIPVQLLPPVPRVDAAGVRVNTGDGEEAVTLTGSGLDRLQSLESDRADVKLQPAGEDGLKRGATVRLHADAKPGERLALMARVAGMSQLVRFPGVLQVAPARPRITEAKAALAREFAAGLKEGELPSGSFASFAIRAEYGDGPPVLRAQCADAARTVQTLTLHAGEKLGPAQLSATGPGMLFLSLDPGAVGSSGCALTASVETEALGKSDPFALGTVVRLPRVESFNMTDEKSTDGFVGVVKGFDLDTIEKTGWDGRAGVNVPEAPRPVAGEGARQTLRISLPWPSPTPKAPLFVFLRGETEGRPSGVAQ